MNAATFDDRARITAIGTGDDAVEEWVKWLLGAVGAALLAIVGGVWALLKDRKADALKAVEDAKTDAKTAHELERQNLKDQITAATLAGRLEVERVKQLADEKARDREALAASFRGVTDQLNGLSSDVKDFRAEFDGQIAEVNSSLTAMGQRVAVLEETVKKQGEVVEKKRAHLNSLAQELSMKGVIGNFDPDSSTGLVAQTKPRRGGV